MRISALRFAIASAALASGAITSTSFAHHSFSSEFDRKQPFNVEGTVNKLEWTNPHGWLLLDVVEDGATVTYRLELSSPSQLMRQGWKRNDLQPGVKVSAEGFRAHTRPHVGRATTIALADGTQLFRGERVED
jgi:hypothetical protein